jgi:hypothetical protein
LQSWAAAGQLIQQTSRMPMTLVVIGRRVMTYPPSWFEQDHEMGHTL